MLLIKTKGTLSSQKKVSDAVVVSYKGSYIIRMTHSVDVSINMI